MLTNNQIQLISNAINTILNQARPHLEGLSLICDLDYSKGREKQPITMAVYSAFVPENQFIDGAIIEKAFYGRHMCLPELHIDGEVYQLYNQSAKPYGTMEVVGKISDLGDRYHIIEFTVSEEYQLIKLEQVDFCGLTDSNRAKILRRLSLI